MMKNEVKVLTVFTGGTIGSKKDALTGLIDTTGESVILSLYEENGRRDIKETYGVDVSFDEIRPYEILSENLTGDEIELLFDSVYEALGKNADVRYDGVIVLTGSDTYAYLSAAMRLLFSEFEQTFISVCSNYPLEDKRSNGLLHFNAAVEMIVNNSLNETKGVFAVYENGFKNAATFYDAGTLLLQPSFSDAVSGVTIGAHTDGNDGGAKASDRKLYERFIERKRHLRDIKVAFIRPYPGMIYPDPKVYEAVILDTYHSGTLPTDERSGFDEFIKKANEADVPVLIAGVSSEAGIYSSEKAYEKDGITVVYDETPVMVYMQTWILLSL